MKHFLLTGAAFMCFKIIFAQNYLGQLHSNVSIVNYSPYFEGLVIADSNIYAARAGGLEILNRNTKQINYHWANLYPLKTILPDSAGGCLFLKDSSRFIGRYNAQTGQLQNIADVGFQSISRVTQIGISPNYKVWAIADSMLAVFNGLSWQWYPLSNGMVPINIKVANDSVAYLADTSKNIYRFYNGTTSLIYHSAFSDWATSSNPDKLYLARGDSLIIIQGSTIVGFNSDSIGDAVLQVEVAGNDHVFVSGYGSKVYDYHAGGWTAITFPGLNQIIGLALDRTDNLYADVLFPWNERDSLYVRNGTGWNTYDFRFNPYKQITEFTTDNYYGVKIATAEGIFYTNSDLRPLNFFDSTTLAYASDVTCFTVSEDWPPVLTSGWGSHHGVYGTNINNAALPDTNINYLMVKGGTYYIGTDKGLCVYNQSTYTIYDTSNSPLPSQKITYITMDDANRLFVGTDKGVAIDTGGSWQVFDTSNVNVANFNVTGIRTNSNHFFNSSADDTSTWVSTMGGGLILLNYNGNYSLMNTQNGRLKDDSLYYVKDILSCGANRIIGTKHHGMAYLRNPYQDTIGYFQLYPPDYWGQHDSIILSNVACTGGYSAGYMIAFDAGILTGGMCEGIKEVGASEYQLKWYTEGAELSALTPDDFTGKGRLMLTDVLGRNLLTHEEELQPGQYTALDVKSLPKGFYVLQLNASGKRAVAKVVLR